jgi:hypothetical protein
MQCFLPITLTPQQQVACGARKWKGLTQTEQMGVIISLLAQIANVQLTCQNLQTMAAQYACLPPQSQLPAVIYLLTLIQSQGVTLQVVNTVGFPNFTPQAAVLAVDDTTYPGDVVIYYGFQGNWDVVIAPPT